MKTASKTISIISLTDNVHKGDDANALGTQREVQQCLSAKGFETECISLPLSETEAITTSIGESPYTIILAAGAHCLPTLQTLKHNPALKHKIHTVWASHQPPSELADAAEFIDSIALPTHVVDSDIKELFASSHATLIETIGVAHNTQIEDLTPEYEKWREHITPASHYTLVVLGGDAPDQSGNMQYYTAEEAKSLGTYLGQKSKENSHILLVTNGPRTGKHNPLTGEVLLSHREVHPETKELLEYQTDAASQAFIDGLESQELVEGEAYQFFDFKFGKDGVVSAYKALLGAVANTPESRAYIPGESTSMVSEACDLLPEGNVVVFNNHAMNAAHEAHITSVYDAGLADHLSTEMHLTPKKVISGKDDGKSNPTSAAATVAENVSETIADQLKWLKLAQQSRKESAKESALDLV